MQQSSGQDGYTTSVGVPPADGGALPHTGSDLGPVFGLGVLLVFAGALVAAALNGWRTPRAAGAVDAPAYLQGGVVPSTYNQE